MSDTVAKTFVANFFDFDMSITIASGIDEVKLHQLEQSLFDLKRKYSATGYIPNIVADIFIDLYSALSSRSYLFADDKRKLFMHDAEYLLHLAREVCSNEQEAIDNSLIVQNFEENISSLYLDMGQKLGINEQKIVKVEQSFLDLQAKYYSAKCIPIEVGHIFIDIYATIENFAELYPKKDRQEFLYTADYLTSLARNVVCFDASK